MPAYRSQGFLIQQGVCHDPFSIHSRCCGVFSRAEHWSAASPPCRYPWVAHERKLQTMLLAVVVSVAPVFAQMPERMVKVLTAAADATQKTVLIGRASYG